MCSDRLDIFKQWIGVATLRVFDVTDIPEDLKLEPLDSELLHLKFVYCLMLGTQVSSSEYYIAFARFLSWPHLTPRPMHTYRHSSITSSDREGLPPALLKKRSNKYRWVLTSFNSTVENVSAALPYWRNQDV
jgi:hypothetical protein